MPIRALAPILNLALGLMGLSLGLTLNLTRTLLLTAIFLLSAGLSLDAQVILSGFYALVLSSHTSISAGAETLSEI